MTRAAGICGVILAAGASTRMGRDKALLPWPPVAEGAPAVNTFLGAMIDLLQAECDQVLVVAGHNADSLQLVVDAHDAFLVLNPKPERGQFSSIQVGLREVLNRGRDAAFLAPVDSPSGTAGHGAVAANGISGRRTLTFGPSCLKCRAEPKSCTAIPS